MSQHDWMPDWKDESAYPVANEASPNQWAWEFLRRNPEYQRDIAELFSDRTPDVLEKKLLERVSVSDTEWVTYHCFLCRKYGLDLSPLPEPSIEKPVIFFKSASGISGAGYFRGQAGITPRGIEEVVLTFRLDWPIEVQLERAKQRLLLERESQGEAIEIITKRNGVKKYPTYLRLLV